jgi:hypothetical protein
MMTSSWSLSAPLRSAAFRSAVLVAASLTVLPACSNEDGTQAQGAGGSGSGSGAGAGSSASGSDSSSSGLLTSSSSGSNQEGCDAAARSVYLLTKERALLRFDPATLLIEEVGTLDCPANGGPAVPIATPFSMAVDRSGTAYVHYNDGSLFSVDVTTASCTSIGFELNQLTAFLRFGMGFSTDGVGSSNETLYLSSYAPGDGLAVLNTTTLGMERLGFYNGGVEAPAELTGTGDGRLYGFFLTTPVQIAELNKQNADLTNVVELSQIDIGNAWAFAFWGDDFWLFTAPNGSTSQVDRMHRGSQVTETMIDDVGFLIVGAGVSTCAPLEPPK